MSSEQGARSREFNAFARCSTLLAPSFLSVSARRTYKYGLAWVIHYFARNGGRSASAVFGQRTAIQRGQKCNFSRRGHKRTKGTCFLPTPAALSGDGVSMGWIIHLARTTGAAPSFMARSWFGADAAYVAYSASQPSTSTDQFQQRFLATAHGRGAKSMQAVATRSKASEAGSGTALLGKAAVAPDPPFGSPKLVRQRL